MSFLNTFDNLSDVETPYTPLIHCSSTQDEVFLQPRRRFRTSKFVLLFLTSFFGVLIFVITYGGHQIRNISTSIPWKLQNITQVHPWTSRGVSQGVSEKKFHLPTETPIYPWTTHMLSWQRTAFHFQPKNNWMNDPNGPLIYKGWYHLFYQYNPQGAVWGNIVWGHAASKDLIHWRHLPIAMVNDSWYDINGVWTGSATILQDGRPIMLYTGSTNESVQVQNLAYPLDLSDPLLINWVKYPGNPVMVPPRIVDPIDFRDPTTAWLTKEGKWRITIGSKFNTTGTSLVYETIDFKEFVRLEGVLHAVAGTGMWECVDFYPVSKVAEIGLDTSEDGPDVKHVMKTSLDDERNDYYSLGTYNAKTGSWTPDDQNIDVGIGMRYDYGIFYASKTFYDHDKKRRVLWGWVKETDSERADIQKGWASLQGIPRTIVFDKETGNDIKFWPVEEVERLRSKQAIAQTVKINPGSVLPLNLSFAADQLDVVAEFQVDEHALQRIEYGWDTNYSCTTSGGSASRGVVGPFGLLVLTDKDFLEQTPLFFYISRDSKGSLNTFFCADHSRSSMATDVAKEIYGGIVPMVVGEKLTMRILVDHSIIEGFAQGGRTCITSRVYPTKAIYRDAHMFLFNNATNATITTSLKIWHMSFALRRTISYMISFVSMCISCSVLLQIFV